MNAIVKTILFLALFITATTAISVLIPVQVTATLNVSLIYFLKTMVVLSPLIPIDKFYNALIILVTFEYYIAVFTVILWLIRSIAQ